MNRRARWTIGILIALVIGLGVGLAIVAGDEGDPETVTVPTEPAETTESVPQPPTTGTVPENGGGTAPEDDAPDGSGGLGFD